MQNLSNKQKGFTLLEIMVVIFILGLLVVLVAPNVLGKRDEAMQQKARSDIATIESAMEMYRLDNFVYPSQEQGLSALTTKPEGADLPNYKGDGYIKRLVQDPWNRDYQYKNPGEHGKFDIYSYGADGVEGGEGVDADIGNWQ